MLKAKRQHLHLPCPIKCGVIVLLALALAFSSFAGPVQATNLEKSGLFKDGDLAWVLAIHMDTLGMVVMRFGPIGIKCESQVADFVADLKTNDIVLYNDQSKKYFRETIKELAARSKRTAMRENAQNERKGWKIGPWEVTGREKILGYQTKVYERKRYIPNQLSATDKVWMLDDRRLDKYATAAGFTASFASRTRFPEPGMPFKKMTFSKDLRMIAEAKNKKSGATTSTVENELELLGPSPETSDYARRSNLHNPAKSANKPDPMPKIKSATPANKPGEWTTTEMEVLSIKREKMDPARWKIPAGYQRVSNFYDVLDLGGLDGTLGGTFNQ